jgi:hypothetical protein
LETSGTADNIDYLTTAWFLGKSHKLWRATNLLIFSPEIAACFIGANATRIELKSD